MDVTGTLYIDHFMTYGVKWTTSIDEVTGPLFIDHLLMLECLVKCTILTDESNGISLH